jgi:hypothetical protein
MNVLFKGDGTYFYLVNYYMNIAYACDTVHADEIQYHTNFIFVGCILLRNVHVRIFQTYNRKFSVAIAGICLKDSYEYHTKFDSRD